MFRIIAFSLSTITLTLCGQDGINIYRFQGLFKNLYEAGPHEFLGKMIEPNDTILEAGAFDGTDTISLSKLVPGGKVISFEPNPPRYAELAEKVKGLANVSTYPYALGEKNGFIKFYVCHGVENSRVYEGASSVLPPAESMEINYQGPRIEVPCFILDDWCRENDVKKIDFMWLDLEGFELQVLQSSPRILKTVKAVYAETNFYEFRKGMTQFKSLKKFLEKNGFKLLSHGYHTGLQGNAIFVRKEMFQEIVDKISSNLADVK